jgi:hypothetical protein
VCVSVATDCWIEESINYIRWRSCHKVGLQGCMILQETATESDFEAAENIYYLASPDILLGGYNCYQIEDLTSLSRS